MFIVSAVAVLAPGRGPQAPVLLQPPSFMATYDFFAKIAQISDFFAFPNFRKLGKFAAFIERPKTKSASALGGFAPWPPDQGLCLWTPLLQLLHGSVATVLR